MADGDTAGEAKVPARMSRGRLPDLERRLAEMSAELAAERARFSQREDGAARHERQRIARVLHNTLCQSLNGASLEAAVLTRKLDDVGSDGSALKVLREMIRHAVLELQDIIQALQQNNRSPDAPDFPRPMNHQNERKSS